MGPIVVATDLTPTSDRALRRAIRIARDCKAGLVLLHVASRADAAATVEALAACCRADEGVDCTALVVGGDPPEAIPAKAADLGASLIVMGPHNRTTLQTMAAGVGASRSVRNVVSPMLIANGQVTGRYAKILVSTDFSPCSLSAVAALKQLGLASDAQTILYHAYEPRPYGGIAAAAMTKEARAAELADLHGAAALALSNFASETGLDADLMVTEPLSASPATMILSKAKQKGADLIVMGTQGKSAVARLVLGSVAEELLRGIDIDLMVVPPSL